MEKSERQTDKYELFVYGNRKDNKTIHHVTSFDNLGSIEVYLVNEVIEIRKEYFMSAINYERVWNYYINSNELVFIESISE